MKTLVLPFHVNFYLDHISQVTLELRERHNIAKSISRHVITNSEFQQIPLKIATAETSREHFCFY